MPVLLLCAAAAPAARASSGPLRITTPSLPEAALGREYASTIRAAVRGRSATFAVVEGALPAGLELRADGTLWGTPRESGRFPVVVEVVDDGAPALAAEAAFELVVPHVILLSGYGPFEGFPVNPAWEAIRPLDGERFGDFEVRAFPLPVVWDEASDLYLERLETDRPSVAIASGVAGGRLEAFSLERLAQNHEEGLDVEGGHRDGTECVPGAPPVLPSTLPLAPIADALSAADVYWDDSDDAGTYLCNHLFYELVYAARDRGIPAGFVHVSDELHGVDELTEGWRVILQAVADGHGSTWGA